MSSITPAAAARQAAQAWVLAFAHGWLAPASADAFADHFQPWFDPHIRLVQPQLPTLVGHQAFRERFARPLFTLIPDLDGQVERFAIGADGAYIELTLRGTSGDVPSPGASVTGPPCAMGWWSSAKATSTRHRCCGPSSPAPGPGLRLSAPDGDRDLTKPAQRIDPTPRRADRRPGRQPTHPRGG